MRQVEPFGVYATFVPKRSLMDDTHNCYTTIPERSTEKSRVLHKESQRFLTLEFQDDVA
jgi:hypothetical protein